jgi:ribonuclease HII
LKRTGKRNPSRLLQFDQDYLGRGFKVLAGVDEAGRGPWAGPVVASAVIVRDFSFETSVDDSKKMTPLTRQRAYGEILAKCQVGIGIVEPGEIDRINILQATFKAMEEALKGLGSEPDCILVDGDKVPKVPYQKFPVIDGDGLSFSIACASVVAKVTRDRIMEYYDGIYPRYGFAGHKGYGTPEHAKALKELGACRIHRKSFGPVRSANREDGNTFNNRLRFAV